MPAFARMGFGYSSTTRTGCSRSLVKVKQRSARSLMPASSASSGGAMWLSEAGRRGWVVLTKDKAIRRNALEHAAIIAAEVVCFSLGHGNLKSEQMAQAFIAARSRMEKALRRYDPPMTASVTSTGHVSVLMTDGKLLPRPKTIK